jgi:hypothetical protein
MSVIFSMHDEPEEAYKYMLGIAKIYVRRRHDRTTLWHVDYYASDAQLTLRKRFLLKVRLREARRRFLVARPGWTYNQQRAWRESDKKRQQNQI